MTRPEPMTATAPLTAEERREVERLREWAKVLGRTNDPILAIIGRLVSERRDAAPAWRREPPTVPGFYPWRDEEVTTIAMLDSDGYLSWMGSEVEYDPKDVGGEWGPRIDLAALTGKDVSK